jgi:hypothetical protein
MANNYVEIARDNRLKALKGLMRNRRHIDAVPGQISYPKTTRRYAEAIFMSSRNMGALLNATAH